MLADLFWSQRYLPRTIFSWVFPIELVPANATSSTGTVASKVEVNKVAKYNSHPLSHSIANSN